MSLPNQQSGWFAYLDPDQSTEYAWQPRLQLSYGVAPTMDIWFSSEESCLTFIKEEVISQNLHIS
jgi:hypothetical protein